MYDWITGNAQVELVTLNENNITLNQNASNYFRDSKYVLVGLSDSLELAIKPVTQRDLNLNLYPKENLHKISIGKTYAKVNNKALCDHIAQSMNKELEGQKIVGHYDELEQVFKIDLTYIKEVQS